MLTVVAIIHILIAILMIGLVLIQDSKGGGAAGVLGGGGSNSLLGATGATTLFEKMTRWTAIGFACTCILLTVLTAKNNSSVMEGFAAPVAPSQVPMEVPAAQPGEAPGAVKTDTPSAVQQKAAPAAQGTQPAESPDKK